MIISIPDERQIRFWSFSKDRKTFRKQKRIDAEQRLSARFDMYIRDPKVWKKDEIYYMIQGARTQTDEGKVLIFESKDRLHWSYKGDVKTEDRFGYMWECPDYFEIEDRKILSVSVQGLEGGVWDNRNVYQSGYFQIDGDIRVRINYRSMNFGIMALTIMRHKVLKPKTVGVFISAGWECRIVKNIRILQRNMAGSIVLHFRERFRWKMGKYCKDQFGNWKCYGKKEMRTYTFLEKECNKVFEVEVKNIKENQFQAVLAKELILEYCNNRFEMRFISQNKKSVSAGRGIRFKELEELREY